jgi:hypothetical protein
VGVVIFLLLLGASGVLLVRASRERKARRERARTVRIEVDGWGVKRWLADGRYEEVGWDELEEVRAITLPKGPWESRLRFVLDGGGERGCIVDVDNAEGSGLISRIAGLPGFDHRLLSEVLDTDRTGTQVLWARTTT